MYSNKPRKKSRWGDSGKVKTSTIVIPTNSESATNSSATALCLTNSTTSAILAKNDSYADRQAKRLYIGNLPNEISSSEIVQFLNDKYMTGPHSTPTNTKVGTSPVANVQLSKEKNFAFVDFTGPEHASAILALLDGVNLGSQILRVRRPKDYTPPSAGDPAVIIRERYTISDLAVAQNTNSTVDDGPNKLFLGNISNKLRPDILMECLWALGDVKSFIMFKRADSKTSKRIAFLQYKNYETTEKALTILQGLNIDGSPLVIERHIRPTTSAETPDYSVPLMAKNLLTKASKILELSGIIEDPKSIGDDDYLKHLEKDVKAECSRFGRVKSFHITRISIASKELHDESYVSTFKKMIHLDNKNSCHNHTNPPNEVKFLPSTSSEIMDKNSHLTQNIKKKIKICKYKGIGKLFIEFTRPEIANLAICNFSRRMFEGRDISTRFYPIKWYQRQFGKGLVPISRREKIRLALETQEKLTLSDAKLFPDADLR